MELEVELIAEPEVKYRTRGKKHPYPYTRRQKAALQKELRDECSVVVCEFHESEHAVDHEEC